MYVIMYIYIPSLHHFGRSPNHPCTGDAGASPASGHGVVVSFVVTQAVSFGGAVLGRCPFSASVGMSGIVRVERRAQKRT